MIGINFYTLINALIKGYIFMAPALVANASAVIFKGIYPIDLGKKFIDSEPIFGKNKTIGGFIGGGLTGFLIGVLINRSIILSVALSFGALTGDLIGAFIKRRLKIKPGQPFPLLDQYDFVFGALIFSYPISQLDIYATIAFLFTVPLIHLFTNVVGYIIKIKRVPW
ncbi:MAG: CDP-2,3-bis-(O-geranylgeranyl)-sn-glycerol synthase [Thermoproteota archaeon]|nr:CDP-2,3-bis-(O-geranylgeranyl)-sn-glycerol synthase [Candidatus Brockarchaeota archaeon]MBO3768010.1 CDP-2,3-bis-(O-geranylgeranyl)-sn-glycerol synthase [Candidatus Brockarchaeota archaeon]MBO3801682.1 CDP-2,3-bis-(O-geranylgeranyl)-sn-glycerol synthase [Candidatus Brockarchaeota archaeon]